MTNRIDVSKTYKTYVDGRFQRSESDRIYRIRSKTSTGSANACRCSGKDIESAHAASRRAFSGWMKRNAVNRGHILYRIGEMLEGRSEQFVKELVRTGYSKKKATRDVEISVDRLIYYAGWTDKYQQIYSTVNPVSGDYFNFSNPESSGTVGLICPDESPLTGLVTMIAAVVAGGNTCIALASESNPLPAITFAEVLHSSDLPAGVVNILSGLRSELVPALASHMDLNAVWNTEADSKGYVDEHSPLNVKRVLHSIENKWHEAENENPYFILEFQEIKTTWHPAGN